MLRLRWLKKRFRKQQAQGVTERKFPNRDTNQNRITKGYHEDSDTTLFV